MHTEIDKKLFSVFENTIFKNYITLSFFTAILNIIVVETANVNFNLKCD